MRGAISLAAAFALPFSLADGTAFPGRNYLLFLTFAVILTTLVFQGLTLPLLIRKLGVKDDGLTDEEERSARIAANSAALGYIDELAGGEGRPNDVVCDCVPNMTIACANSKRVARRPEIPAARWRHRNINNCSRKPCEN